MQNYSQWQHNKLYFEHVDRLSQIRQRRIKKKSKSKQHIQHSERYNTQPTKTIKNRTLPLPLVSQTQRKLLGETVNSKQLSLKQKQIILQNYLLGKRILTTQSVFNAKQLKKQYRLHLKISKNMSKSLKSKNNFDISRQERYQQYQRQQILASIPGKGNYLLEIKINQLKFIRKQLRLDNSSYTLYNIFLKLPYKKYGQKPFTSDKLTNQTFRFNFRRKDINLKTQTLTLQLQMMKGNQVMKVGDFIIDMREFLEKNKLQKCKYVQNLTRDSRRVVIGTLQLLISIGKNQDSK